MDNAIQKKRQRPIEWRQRKICFSLPQSMISIASIALLSSQTATTAAYNVLAPPTRVRRPHSYRAMRLDTVMTSADDITEEEEKQTVSADSWLKTLQQGEEESPPLLPPWLSRLEEELEIEDPSNIMRQVEWFENALLEQNFSPQDVEDVITTMEKAACGDITKFIGSMEFCHLLLQLEEPSPGHHVFVTKQVLLASILHYNECVTARQTGVYELVKQACKQRMVPVQARQLPECQEEEQGQQAHNAETEEPEIMFDDNVLDSLSPEPLQLRQIESKVKDELVEEEVVRKNAGRAAVKFQATDLGEEVMRIAAGAARIKQVEIVAHAVLGEAGIPSMEEASRLRGLLLSVMDDWRALAIRSAASLYRLEGIFNSNRGTAEYLERTPQVVQTARDALRIYAPLAQRLGMHRLKSQLEGLAFRILYRRQYQAVSSLYRQSGATWDAREAMQSVSTYLTKHITQVLHQDEKLMGQLDDLKVTARVKEPYSLWKKLLMSRKSKPKALREGSGGSSSLSSQSELSVLEVLDAVALRIVLKARKWTPDEPDDVTRDRERLLCYYVQEAVRDYWPATDETRIKDYIQAPKPNGYQSLHYTSSISCFGEDWPFEVQVRSLALPISVVVEDTDVSLAHMCFLISLVQVRSEEMHRIAEYGVAAHWDYKLKGGTKSVAQISPAENDKGYTLLLPPAESVSDVSVSDPLVAASPSDETDPTPTSTVESKPVDSYIDALVTAREDLVQQSVFIFFTSSSKMGEDGQLLSLPVGAKVRDALAQLESQLGRKLAREGSNNLPPIYRNGRLAEMDDFVGTGDLLLVDM